MFIFSCREIETFIPIEFVYIKFGTWQSVTRNIQLSCPFTFIISTECSTFQKKLKQKKDQPEALHANLPIVYSMANDPYIKTLSYIEQMQAGRNNPQLSDDTIQQLRY